MHTLYTTRPINALGSTLWKLSYEHPFFYMYEDPILFSHCSYGRARVLSLNHANNNNTWISLCRFLYTEFNSNIVRIEFSHTQIQAHIHTQVRTCRHSGSGVLCMELWANFARKRKTNNFHIHYDVCKRFIHLFLRVCCMSHKWICLGTCVCVCVNL